MSYTLIDMANKYLPPWKRFDGITCVLSRETVLHEVELLSADDAEALLRALRLDGGNGVTLRWTRDNASISSETLIPDR